MNYHLVLILAKVLDWVALAEIATEGNNHEFLEKFITQHALGERRVGCICSDCSEFVVGRHPRFLDSLLHELVENLDADELFSLPLNAIVLIPREGM